MGSEILGTKFKYTIDTSYGINKDGFIAIGTESIVYKALKTAIDGGLQFSCVLKFKPRTILVNGVYVDKLKAFREEELKIFEELQECRSIARIYDVIDDLGDFSVVCDKVSSKVISGEKYFCVVEEYVDGWSLEEYCRRERWKLNRIENLENGLSRIIDYNDYTDAEKEKLCFSYYKNYDNVLKYQSEIFQFMINLCEILEFATEKKDILHLDIKPENIMVTKYGKELVLIDFGRSKKIAKSQRYIMNNLGEVDYSGQETVDKMYEYGTLGYAAPECYAKASSDSTFPFETNFEQGKMTIESDIFSFGATFWECLNIFELVTKNEMFCADVHDFYKENFLNDAAYCNRDLSLTSLHYHKKLEDVIRKCTRKRSKDYLNPDNSDFYHSYKDLKKDIEDAKNSSPTIVRAENIKVKNSFSLFGSLLGICMVLLIISGIYRAVGFTIAQDKWDELISNYNVTQFHKLESIAEDLVKTAPVGSFDDTYSKILRFTYENGDIDVQEATLLVRLLQDNKSDMQGAYINEIMQYSNTKSFKEISAEIIKLDMADGIKCEGYELAEAIYKVEVGKTDIVKSYQTLKNYKDNIPLQNAVIKLKNVLDNDTSIELISQSEGVARAEIQSFLKSIGG